MEGLEECIFYRNGDEEDYSLLYLDFEGIWKGIDYLFKKKERENNIKHDYWTSIERCKWCYCIIWSIWNL